VRAVEAFGQFEHVLGVGEDLFASYRDRKKELIHRRSWPAKRELGSAVFEYIKAFYNHERRRSTLGMLHATNTRSFSTLSRTRKSPAKKPSQEVSLVRCV
jgi:transposase InsO family protein